MKHTFTIIFCSFLFMANLSSQFFLPTGVVTKIDIEGIKVRWEPTSIAEWKQSKVNGYAVKLYEVDATSKVRRLVDEQKVFPLPYNSWDMFLSNVSPFKQQFYLGARNQLYPENLKQEDEKITSVYKGETQSGLDSIMLGLLIYSGTYDFNLSKISGLGAVFKKQTIQDYEIEISSGSNKIVVKSDNTKKDLPKLSGVWGDRVVNLKWSTKDFKSQYFGYIIDKSDNGLTYTMKDSLPYVNFNFGSATSKVDLIEKTDSLAQNEKVYYYRLRGMDYFGDYTNVHSSITGFGSKQLTLSPYIVFADQTEDNRAHLQWEIQPSQLQMLKDFTLFRTDTTDGTYEIAVKSIPPNQREIKIPMEFTINYYRIEANSKSGASLSSMPVFVMGQDTIPPKVPEVISANVNEKGIVNIQWKKNIEPDLWGYRVFIANFKEDEFSLLTEYPTMDTFFVDTINLKMGLDNIYYLIHAADKRNNMSVFTDTIRLQLPDILPPAPPVLLSLSQSNDSIFVNWVNSPAKDLKEQQLFRREVKGNTSWIKIATFDSAYQNTTFTDPKLVYGMHYAYTMVAIDKSNLESRPEQYLDWLLEKPKEKFIPFKDISYSIDPKQNKVVLNWQVNGKDKYKHVTIYRGTDKARMGKYKMVDGPEMSVTDSYSPGTKVYYRLKPAFSEQTEVYFSDYIEVVSSSVPSKSK